MLIAADANASAWLQGEGKWFTASSFVLYQADTFVDRNGDDSGINTFRKYEFNPYIEYGLTKNITLGTNLFANKLTQSGQDNHGIGDTEFFARLKVAEVHGWIFSVQPLIKLDTGLTDSAFPEIGSDGTDLELRWLAGTNYGKNNQHYFDVEAAYRSRLSGNLSDQIKLDAKTGLAVCDRFVIEPAISATFATDINSSAAGAITQSSDYDLAKGQISAIYKYTDNMNFQVGYSHDIRSRNTGKGDGLMFSVWNRF